MPRPTATSAFRPCFPMRLPGHAGPPLASTAWRKRPVRNAIADLSECREFALVLQARPPRLVHAALILASLLLGTAVTWSALTQADLVVRAPGRVRPTNPPTKVIYTPRGEGAATGLGGRVAEVRFKAGDEVRAGDV